LDPGKWPLKFLKRFLFYVILNGEITEWHADWAKTLLFSLVDVGAGKYFMQILHPNCSCVFQQLNNYALTSTVSRK